MLVTDLGLHTHGGVTGGVVMETMGGQITVVEKVLKRGVIARIAVVGVVGLIMGTTNTLLK